MKLIKIILTTVVIGFTASSNAETFKIASSAPDGSFWMKQMREGAKKIKQLTDGRVLFKFYPGGIMGSEEVMMKKIRIHQLQGAAVTNGELARFYGDSQIYGLPMLFKTYDEVDHVRKVIDKKIIQGLAEGGMISFGLSEGGFAYAMSINPITKVADLENHKVWTPTNNKQAELTLESFGISPIPLNVGDVLAGLQTNLIDTIAVSPITAIALQWHTQIKYITNIPLMYIYATLLIDKESFEKITNDDQLIVKKVMAGVFKNIDEQNRKDNELAFKALTTQGVKIVTPDKVALGVWNNKGESARKLIKTQGVLSVGAVDEITKLLADFRKNR